MKRVLSMILMCALSLGLLARPARPGVIQLTQPDGSRFNAVLMGDEFMKIKMTEAGEAVIQDADGWWCYAVYDAQGQKMSTGIRVGAKVSASDLTDSRNIPYDVLARRATIKKNTFERNRMLRHPQRLQAAGTALDGDKAGLVILVEFQGSDGKFSSSREQFNAMLTQEGYSVNGATGSAKEYFDDQFKGKCTFSFDVTDVVTLSKNRKYYGANDSNGDDVRPHEMVMEACSLVDASVDFAKYDQDGDGEVDNVFVFYAGLDEAAGAGDDHIWAHAWYIKDGAGENLRLDGVVINRYACASELEGSSYVKTYMTGIGTFCHEYSHTLGLPDFYDCDYNEGGYAASLWQCTSLMDGGNYNNDGNTPPYYNAMEREILGLSSPTVITGPGAYELSPVNEGQYYRMNTSRKDEYFLIEYRDGSGWDGHVGGEGVLIYHVDKSNADSGYSYLWERNITAADRWESQIEINSLASRQCGDLIEADGRKDAFSTYNDRTYNNLLQSLQGLFFPYGNVSLLTSESKPGLACWDDAVIDFGIKDIAVRNGKASFTVVRISADLIPVAVNVTKDIFQESAILAFESSEEFDGEAIVTYRPSGSDERKSVTVRPYEAGRWALELKDLKPMTSYSVEISFTYAGAQGEIVEASLMTKKQPEDGMPYIYFGDAGRNDDGTFRTGSKIPLKVFNASGAKSVRWELDGSEIRVDKDFYYTLPSSGTLTARVCWEDESEDVIIKKIRISDK